MSKNKLAILGGKPIRTKQFEVAPFIDQDEEEMLLRAVKDCNFSRYIGSDSYTLGKELRLTSKDAADIIASWHFLGGPNVRAFASEFAEIVGVDYVIPVNSATTGLSVALAAMNIEPGDEVIVTGLSFSATASAILMFNAIPVFVDVDPHTFCMDPKSVEEAISDRTKAILAVHLLGNCCDMDALLKISANYNLKLLEDCAQAIGVKWKGRHVGTIGDAGVFSFQQSKNITTGEGGVVVSNNEEIAARCRLIINHGEVVMHDYHSDEQLANIIGFNFRMPELCAALGRAQLNKLDKVNKIRNENARYLIKGLSHLDGLIPPYFDLVVEPVYHVLAFLYQKEYFGFEREIFIAALRAEGIPVGTGYVRPMYENPIFLKKIAYGTKGYPWQDCNSPSPISYVRGQCPVIERLLNEEFIWFYHIAYPSTSKDMDDIITAVNKIAQQKENLQSNDELVRASGDTSKKQGRL